MFRHEKPQNGHLHQFTQFGVKNIGSYHPFDDIQLTSLAHDCLTSIGVGDHVILSINTIGTLQERLEWQEKLTEYLASLVHLLSLIIATSFEF